MNDSELTCQDERRREDVRKAALFGLDFVEVSDDQLTLEVFFLGKAPAQIAKANVVITGGSLITNINVANLIVHRQSDPDFDDYLEVRVDKYGDFSTYTLSLVALDKNGLPTSDPMAGFDPRYDSIEFTFKAGCPSDQDCKPQSVCPPPPLDQPEINYLAKDYASFRQLILDRLALVMPNWTETHVPDIGIMLVEVLAYVGDYLSYYQDAVATEAYLGIARQRISVRRHARLVDYAMHEGCNARAWVTVKTDTDTSLDPQNVYFCTAFAGAPASYVLQPADITKATPGTYETFEPLVADPSKLIQIYSAHSEIHFYTWGNCECCLATGATAATLIDSWKMPASNTGTGSPSAAAASAAVQAGGEPPGSTRTLNLKVGDVLIFEEVIGPGTGNPADADPKHRQAVKLTKVKCAIDPLYHPSGPNYGQPIVEIEWCSEDALTFPLCISAKMPAPDCTCRENLSVARGNVVFVDNSNPVGEPLGTVPTFMSTQPCPTDCEPGEVVTIAGRFCPILKRTPLTFGQPLPACGCASQLVVQDPRQALPRITLTETLTTPEGKIETTTWTPKSDLLESGANDPDFVVEVDDNYNAHLRFGNGDEGRMPDAGAVFTASYGIGNGTTGNVGAETIVYLVYRTETGNPGNLVPRNPLPASGGTAPEPVAEVKMFAPYAFQDVLERAVTAADYAALAADNDRRLEERPALLIAAMTSAGAATTGPALVKTDDPRAALEEEPRESALLPPDICSVPFQRLQGAKGTLRWNGSWYQAEVAVDPVGIEDAPAELLEEITAYLEPYRRVGHDLGVQGANYVGLDLALGVCVKPNYLSSHVESTLLNIFSNRVLPDGSLGFFHPNNLTFGTGIFSSQIVAAAQAVPGVIEVTVQRLERYEIGEPPVGKAKAADEVTPAGVLALGPFEIARLDNDPNYPENGRLTLTIEGGR